MDSELYVPFLIFMILVNFIIPTTFLIFGIIYSKRPPKKINPYSGYRTALSMKNIDTWIFAHRVFGRILLLFGVILLLIAIIIGLFALIYCGIDTIIIITVAQSFFQLIFMFVSCALIETALRKKFDENGNIKNALS